jgi:hypothetical protein
MRKEEETRAKERGVIRVEEEQLLFFNKVTENSCREGEQKKPRLNICQRPEEEEINSLESYDQSTDDCDADDDTDCPSENEELEFGDLEEEEEEE